MTSITPRLNCSYRRKDGSYPVVIRIIRHRKKREIETPYYLWEKEFDNRLNRAVEADDLPRSSGDIERVNRYLANVCNELAQISDVLFHSKGEKYTSSDVADAYRFRNDMSRLFVYADTLIEHLNSIGSMGTACNYRSACRALEAYAGGRTLAFDEFTADYVDGFVDYLKKRGNQDNTVVCYLRQLRAIYNKGLRAQVVCRDLRPFRNQSMREVPTRKRALPKHEVKRIESAKLQNCHPDVQLARDLFMASFYGRGIPFIDLCYLRKENIEGNYIFYQRRKTSRPLCVLIEKPLKELLVRYSEPDSPYLFPMLRGASDERRGYLNAKSRLGKRIRELGTYLHLTFPLTFHVSRHTWATLAHNAGVGISVISNCLGHLSEKITSIYLAEMDRKLLDRANRKVLKLLV